MHEKCENCGKMIQDYWRMVKVEVKPKTKSKSGKNIKELEFCSEACKLEYEKKMMK